MLDAGIVFKRYAAARSRKLRRLSSVDSQRRILLHLVERARATRFGIDHGFADVKDVRGYQIRTPVRDFRAFWDQYWRESFPLLRDCTWPGLIPYFALSSGTTTGTTKYIPHTHEMTRAAIGGMRELLVHHFTNRPDSRLLGGTVLMLTGAHVLERLAPGVNAGDISAITAVRSPVWIRHRILPPPHIAAIQDWQKKIQDLAPLSLERDVRGLGGSPNWLLLFLAEVSRLLPGNPQALSALYPNLELIVHGGINFAPYRRLFEKMLQGGHAETREVYSASEGLFAVADQGDGEGLRMVVDGAVFFEFIPVEELESPTPTRHWIANLEVGRDYAIAITNHAGLWSYTIGDTVRFVSRDPPRLHVTGRTAYSLSAQGEHLIEAEIAEAVAAAAEAIGVNVTDYVVSAAAAADGELARRHEYIVECVPSPDDPADVGRFARVLDQQLCALNDDYRGLRRDDYSLLPPRVRLAPTGGFASWMSLRGRLGGQNKVPRIIHDPDRFAELCAFMAAQDEVELMP